MRVIVFLVISILLLITSYYFFFFRNSSNEQIVKYDGPIEKITVANVGQYSVFNLIAKDKSLFNDNGLDATVNEYQSGQQSISALTSGKADFAIAGDFSVVSSITNNKDIRIIADVSTQEVSKITARKDKGILQPKDLKDKRVGITSQNFGAFFLDEFLTLNGLQFSDVQIVDLPPADIVNQLLSGEIDAAVTFDPYSYNLEQALKDNVIVWSSHGTRDGFSLALTTETYLKAHPDTVKRYLNSLINAEDFLKANLDESKTIISKDLNSDESYINYIWAESKFSVNLQQALLLNLDDEERFRIRNNLTTETVVPNYLNFIYIDALAELKPEAISIIR